MRTCAKCEAELEVVDNYRNGGLISWGQTTDGHTETAHRWCPGTNEAEVWKAYEADALARGFAHGQASGNGRHVPNKTDWSSGRMWAASHADPAQDKRT